MAAAIELYTGNYVPEEERLSIGERVVFINDWLRQHCPGVYPPEGVAGIVTGRPEYGVVAVKWPDGCCRRDGEAWGTRRENLIRESEWKEKMQGEYKT